MPADVRYLVAPTERPPISALGASSSLPEKYGADVLWGAPGHEGGTVLCGVQRKAHMDLVASVRDNRLGRELQQMAMLSFRCVVIEGTPRWSLNGDLLDAFTNWTLKQQRGVEMSIQQQGVWVLWTRRATETVQAIEQLALRSLQPPGTSSLLYGKPIVRDGWGRLSDRATGVHFMSTIPGIGVELAGRIFDRFGRVPMRWSCELAELLEVPGIGPKRGKALWALLAP